LSRPQVADASAGLDDLAGSFKPRRKGKRRLDLVAAANHQGVSKIDARRTHSNAHLMRLQLWALRFFEAQGLGRTPR
jgi:hypothetical protein